MVMRFVEMCFRVVDVGNVVLIDLIARLALTSVAVEIPA
jgi:hypothetical protein